MMDNIIEILRNLIQKNPESAVILGNLTKLAEEHPKWNKISDFPPFSVFPAIEWDNEKVLKIILDSVMENATREMNNYLSNVQKGTELNFVIDLIRNFALCKCAANALQAKFDVQDDPGYKDAKFKQNLYSHVMDKN